MSNPILDAAQTKRSALQNDLELITLEPSTEARSLTDDETAAFEATVASIKKLDGQIEMLSAEEARKATAAAAAVEIAADAPVAAPVVIRSEPMTYTEHSGSSYLMDLAAIQIPQAGMNAEAARSRMARHGQEVEVEARSNPRLAKNLAAAQREARAATNTALTGGGDLVPPLYLIDQWVPAFRPGRIIAGRIRNMELPAGTDSVNLPKISVGTVANYQGAAVVGTNAGLSSTDLTTANISAPVNTYYGQLEASLQLLEQSPVSGGMDQVIFQDLQAAYDYKLDSDLLAGAGTGGQHQGILTYAAGVAGSVTYTGAAATAFTAKGGVFTSVVSAVNSIETSRYASPTALWVHPRRANAMAVAVDSAGRPLFVKNSNGPFNTVGNQDNTNVAQGVDGELYGLPVIKDASIPTNWLSTTSAVVQTGGLAGTTAQDVMVAVKEDDIFLWEGPTRLRALAEVSSGTLGVRFQLFAYSAFMPNRTSTAISIITGPALNATSLGF